MQVLVGAEVEGADGHRSPGHALDHLLVGLELFLLVGHVAAVEEEEFGAEQADAFGAAFERVGNVARQFDVGVEGDVDAVERDRARGLQALELVLLQLDLLHA